MSTYSWRVLLTRRFNLVAYYPIWEAAGTTAISDESESGHTGTYSNVTLGEQGIGDGRTAGLWNGTTSYGNIYSSSLRDAFNSNEGTVGLWFKPAAGAMTDGITRRMIRLEATNQNRIFLHKSATNNAFNMQYIAGGTTKSVEVAAPELTDWIHLALTWNKTADQVIGYINGVQYGDTLTGLGTWVGSLSSNGVQIGAGSLTPVNVTHGWLAHVFLYNVALNAAEMSIVGSNPASSSITTRGAVLSSQPFVTRDQIYDVLEDTTQSERNNRLIDEGIRAVHSRIEQEIGTPYNREVTTRRIDASHDPDITIPGFGAETIVSVLEDGVALSDADWLLDPDDPHILTRLDSEGRPQNWQRGRRIVTLTYVPARVPESIVDAERIEVVRWFRGAEGAYADRIGVDGTQAVPYSYALSKATKDTIAAQKRGRGSGIW